MNLSIDPQTTALVMVDMQNDFCHPEGFYGRVAERVAPLGLEPSLVTDGIPAMASLLEAARAAGLFIVHTRIERDDSPDAVHLIHNVVAQTFGAVADAPGGPALMPGTWARIFTMRLRRSRTNTSSPSVVSPRSLEPILRRRCDGVGFGR